MTEATDQVWITQRGRVFTGFDEYTYEELKARIGQNLYIDGEWYTVSGIESTANLNPQPPFGVIVKQVKESPLYLIEERIVRLEKENAALRVRVSDLENEGRYAE